MNEVFEIAIKIGIGVLIIIMALYISLLLKGLDRRFAAWLQARVGPPLRQPIWDTFKLFQKENIIPERAVPWAFNGAPLLALVASLAILLYLPLGPIGLRGITNGAEDWFTPVLSGYGDLILLIYLLAIPGLMIAVGGFSSGSPLSTVGAQREMVMMMSYELPLAVVVLSMAWRLTNVDLGGMEVFSLETFVKVPLWNEVGPLGIFGLLLLAGVFFLIIPSELSKIPFDAPEAETEIGGGVIAEYSGANLAMFYLSDAVKTVAFTSLAVALFFPYNLSPVIETFLQEIGVIGADTMLNGWVSFGIDMLFWLVKIEVIYFFAVTVVRVGAARLKVDKISWLYLVPLSVISLVGVLLLYLDVIVG
ncbi:MAG: NADH-quinone oxidoreductase subunit H [Candidatus Thermoplasmatota archaeon]|nr:NADH-quinone oxidoreductase subunit H [Candidatus Thermoplasmatota archaeon]